MGYTSFISSRDIYYIRYGDICMTNILQMLENSAEKYPDKKAFIDPTGFITFSELMDHSKKVGSFLAQHTIPGQAVAYYLEKSTLAMCGLMGAIYAGCHYVVVDLRQPETRIRSIESTLSSSVILTDMINLERAQTIFSAPVYTIESILDSTKVDEKRLSFIRERSLDIDPLYVNFTSGSTGTPKGVTVSHRSVIDFIPIFTEIFRITSDDILGNQAPFDFDVSVKDIYSGLCTGATVLIIPRSYFSNPTQLMDYLCDNNVTVLIWAVSAMCFVSIMNGFQYRNPSTLRTVLFSGEVMPVKQLNILKTYQPGVHFVNLYGPTEITCNCTYHFLEDRLYEKEERIPIGRTFPNEKVFLLDENNQEITVPNTPGELCVSGTCLALGYYSNPEKTKEVFTQNPLNTRWQESIYRTGDLCSYTEAGDLVYLSRKDFQIKHMGHRIELGEIESASESCEGISRACCLYDSRKKKLLLFYVGDTDKETLLESLRSSLPAFMIPNKVFPLEFMPMTKNGKIDRSSLKEIGGIKD